MTGVLCSIAASVMFISLYEIKKNKIDFSEGITFLFIMLLGSQLSWAGIILSANLNMSPKSETCFNIFFLETIGFTIVYGCIFAKILHSNKYSPIQTIIPKLGDPVILKLLTGYIISIVCFILLLVGSTFLYYHPKVVMVGSFHLCANMEFLQSLNIFFEGAALISGFLVVSEIKNALISLKDNYWAFKSIGILSILFCFYVFSPIIFDDNPILNFIIRTGKIVAFNMIPLLLMVLPKLVPDISIISK